MHLLAKALVRPSAEPALPEDESFVHAPGGLTLIHSVPQGEISPSKMPSPADTLFTYGFDAGPRPASFVVSILVHNVAAAIILFGVAYKPSIVKVDTAHYTARRLDLLMPDQQRRTSEADAAYPSKRDTTPKPASGGKRSPPRQPVLRQMAQAKPGPQTLIQPDLLAQVTLTEEIPVPQIVIWTPSKTPVKNIVPPLPQKPAAADVKPTIDMPNPEVNLADINIASSDHPSPRNMVLASTTSPVAIQQPEQVQLPPVSATQNAAQPTPATILSLSDLRMKDGTTMLPPANESAAANAQGALSPGRVQDSPPQGSGNPNAKLGQGGDLPSESSGQPTLTQVKLPKDGRFSAVVVGDALENEYPQVAGAWSGRTAYTAYLHVGLAKSWILQFSLPRDADASAGGTVARLDAPWPYDIVRPNIEPGSIDADALMIHGFIDLSGRFQGLSVAFPPAFPQAQFVLEALKKWQFRPAMQNGQPIRVEMLMIVPDIED